MARHRFLLFVILLTLTPTLFARVLSYAPYTDRTAIPAQQHRMNRHFVLIESSTPGAGFLTAAGTEVVVYDFLGEHEPRKVFPQSGTASIVAAAAREQSNGQLAILILAYSAGSNALHFSANSGESWTSLTFFVSNPGLFTTVDTGGPFIGSRDSFIRIGNEETPFVVASGSALIAISSTGSVRTLMNSAPAGAIALDGRDATGSRFLVRTGTSMTIVDTSGSVTPVNTAQSFQSGGTVEGWITPTGAVYAEERVSGRLNLWFFDGSTPRLLLTTASNGLNLFAVPTFDSAGAWIIERGGGRPTVLYKHTAAAGLVKQWEDITAPEVEALHTGSSGQKLLIQVHRPRVQQVQRFIDPALAVWTVGQPAPRVYDELFMNEETNKGFVHLDVEKLEAGEPFVFDSGVRWIGGGGGGVSAGGGGGGDVIQEWGVVRSSIKQRLVLPSFGRTAGAYGSFWMTDLTLYNPQSTGQNVTLRFVPNGESTTATAVATRSVHLLPREIQLIPDALMFLFGLESGNGALYITPDAGVTATSRTFNRTGNGTYGFGMNAIDLFAAPPSPRFPMTFAGAFLGPDYRTNVILTDTGTGGADAAFSATGQNGFIGQQDMPFQTPAGASRQINALGPILGVLPYETGALLVRPLRGAPIASVFVTDNRTNDSTYFPPDISTTSTLRTIPAIGHVDGANNAKFRSDLYLFNPSSSPRSIFMTAQMWDTAQQVQLSYTLLPFESRVIRDVLLTAFGRTGIARLQFQTNGSVGVTSRTYNVDDNGGTYGFLMPPVNNFQIAGSGETLEILGPIAHGQYRTNIGLVDTITWGGGGASQVDVRIIDASAKVLDTFTATVQSGSGLQINDLFRARGIEYEGAALIRITPRNGSVAAYATWTDNRTNDSVYFGANLASQE